MPPTTVELNIAEKAFGAGRSRHVLFKDFHLSFDSNHRWAVMGRSGIGKTTLFRILGGLDAGFSGTRSIKVRGAEGPARIGFVFQDKRLFPWLTVEANVEFPLLADTNDARRRERVATLLHAVGMQGREHAYPGELSGGQIARVALARALVVQPDLLVLDEPLSGLDRSARISFFDVIERIQREAGFLQILVSHQAEEVAALADRVHLLTGSPAHPGTTIDIPLGGQQQWLNPQYFEVTRQLEVQVAQP